ncbi:unnamed protein product [Cochlearia groenlandica]
MAESDKHEREDSDRSDEDGPAKNTGEEDREAEQIIENPQQQSVPSGSMDQNRNLAQWYQPALHIAPMPTQYQYINHQNPYTLSSNPQFYSPRPVPGPCTLGLSGKPDYYPSACDPGVPPNRLLGSWLLGDVPVDSRLVHRVLSDLNQEHVPQTMHLMSACQVSAAGQPPTRPVIVNQHHNTVVPYHHDDRVIGIVVRRNPASPMPVNNLNPVQEIEQYQIVAYQYRNQPTILFHQEQGQAVPLMFTGQAISVYSEQQQMYLIDQGLHFVDPIYIRKVSPAAAAAAAAAAQPVPVEPWLRHMQQPQRYHDEGVYFIFPIDMIRQVPTTEAGARISSQLHRHYMMHIRRCQWYDIGEYTKEDQDRHQSRGSHTREYPPPQVLASVVGEAGTLFSSEQNRQTLCPIPSQESIIGLYFRQGQGQDQH